MRDLGLGETEEQENECLFIEKSMTSGYDYHETIETDPFSDTNVLLVSMKCS